MNLPAWDSYDIGAEVKSYKKLKPRKKIDRYFIGFAVGWISAMLGMFIAKFL